MNPERAERVRTLFEGACDLPVQEREEFLRDACRGDESLRDEIERLLDCDERWWPFVDEAPAGGVMVLGPIDPDEPEALPEATGRYRILREIGRGASAIVFEAQQEMPRRRVAVKLLRPGPLNRPAMRRFQFETELLGRLEHPFIARIYDAGTTDVGLGPQLFFAMELVDGQPLLQYARGHDLSVRQRLELLTRICEGVHHAHTKGVVHRDLKPHNIYVDSKGEPRILDFGVARAADCDAATMTRTAVGQLIGTLQYMSPEQVAGRPDGIDSRSDIYALGVIGYQLLADRLPYDVAAMALPEAVRVIAEREAPRLGSIDRRLRGDVETIVAKAMEKDRHRRYQSAADLAADLRRHLDHEPISARPPAALYQLGKFARRNTALFASMVAAAVILLLGTAGTTYGLIQARQGEQDAESRLGDAMIARDEAESVTSLLVELLSASDPEELGRDVKVREVLEEASTSIAGQLPGKPLVEARLRGAIGACYTSLGEYASAQEHLEEALRLQRAHAGAAHPPTLSTMHDLARLYQSQGRHKEAEAMGIAAWEGRVEALGDSHRDTLSSMANLGYLYVELRRLDEAEPLLTRALEARRRVLGENHRHTLHSLMALGVLRARQGRYGEAEELQVSAVEGFRATCGDEHPRTLDSMNNLAFLYRRQGRFAEAESLYEQVMRLRPAVMGEAHPRTLEAMAHLGSLWGTQDRFAEAEALLEQALELTRSSLGAEHPRTLLRMNNLAVLYGRQGRHEESEALFRELVEMSARVWGEDHRNTLEYVGNLAIACAERGRVEESLPLLERVVDARERTLGIEHPDTLQAIRTLALVYAELERYDDALPLMEQNLERRSRVLGATHVSTAQSMQDLANLYRDMGRYEEAEALYQPVLAINRQALGEDHQQTLRTCIALAGLYRRMGDLERAEPLYADALARARRALPEGHPTTVDCMLEYGRSLRGAGRLEQAELLLVEAHPFLAGRLGEWHPSTLDAVRELVALFEASGRPELAAEWQARLPADEEPRD